MSTTKQPPLHFLATIKLRPGKMAQFCELMPRVIAIMEAHGWHLMGAWTHLGGRLNVVINLWQIPDANALPSGLGTLMAALDWPEIAAALAEYVEDETIQLLTKVPFDPGRIPER